jgi:hypothetical protein
MRVGDNLEALVVGRWSYSEFYHTFLIIWCFIRSLHLKWWLTVRRMHMDCRRILNNAWAKKPRNSSNRLQDQSAQGLNKIYGERWRKPLRSHTLPHIESTFTSIVIEHSSIFFQYPRTILFSKLKPHFLVELQTATTPTSKDRTTPPSPPCPPVCPPTLLTSPPILPPISTTLPNHPLTSSAQSDPFPVPPTCASPGSSAHPPHPSSTSSHRLL